MSILPPPLSIWQKKLQENPGNTENAQKVIREYFDFFGASAAKDELWFLTASTLSNEESGHCTNKPETRANLLFYYEFTKLFIDAVYTLHHSETTS